jgi:hypothetical protein
VPGRAGSCNDAQHRAKERGESGLDVNSRTDSGGDEAERVLALIESGLRHALQARLKKAGAAWLIDHANPIARLRVLRADQRWQSLWH